MWPFEYKYNVQCFWLKRILNIIIQVGIFREYEISASEDLNHRRAFSESTEISSSEDLNALEKAPPQIMPLQILGGKGAVQIMPFRKLGGKFHFFLRFCTRKRSKTYKICHTWTPCQLCPRVTSLTVLCETKMWHLYMWLYVCNYLRITLHIMSGEKPL